MFSGLCFHCGRCRCGTPQDPGWGPRRRKLCCSRPRERSRQAADSTPARVDSTRYCPGFTPIEPSGPSSKRFCNRVPSRSRMTWPRITEPPSNSWAGAGILPDRNGIFAPIWPRSRRATNPRQRRPIGSSAWPLKRRVTWLKPSRSGKRPCAWIANRRQRASLSGYGVRERPTARSFHQV